MTRADPNDPEGSLRMHLANLRRAIEDDRTKTAEACAQLAERRLKPARERQAIRDAWIDFELRTRDLKREVEFIAELLARAMPRPPITFVVGNPTDKNSVFAQFFSQKS